MNIWNYNKGSILKYILPENVTCGKIYDHLWHEKSHFGYIQSFVIKNGIIKIIDEIDVPFKVESGKIKNSVLMLTWNRDYNKETTRLEI